MERLGQQSIPEDLILLAEKKKKVCTDNQDSNIELFIDNQDSNIELFTDNQNSNIELFTDNQNSNRIVILNTVCIDFIRYNEKSTSYIRYVITSRLMGRACMYNDLHVRQ